MNIFKKIDEDIVSFIAEMKSIYKISNDKIIERKNSI